MRALAELSSENRTGNEGEGEGRRRSAPNTAAAAPMAATPTHHAGIVVRYHGGDVPDLAGAG